VKQNKVKFSASPGKFVIKHCGFMEQQREKIFREKEANFLDFFGFAQPESSLLRKDSVIQRCIEAKLNSILNDESDQSSFGLLYALFQSSYSYKVYLKLLKFPSEFHRVQDLALRKALEDGCTDLGILQHLFIHLFDKSLKF
jgi:hypothetical protein